MSAEAPAPRGRSYCGDSSIKPRSIFGGRSLDHRVVESYPNLKSWLIHALG